MNADGYMIGCSWLYKCREMIENDVIVSEEMLTVEYWQQESNLEMSIAGKK